VEEVVRSAKQCGIERVGENARVRKAGPATPDEEIEWTYRANPDTPYRRRTQEQIYETAEELGARDIHRGEIVDRKT
jgi:hypothetical protein